MNSHNRTISDEKNDKIVPIVIGDGLYNDLGIIRSLGERDLNPIYITNNRHIIPVEKSKYIQLTTVCNLDKDLLSVLNNIATRYHKKLVLFPTTDRIAVFLDENAGLLSEFCYVPNAEGKLSYYMNKFVQTKIAETAGFLIPKSRIFNPGENSCTETFSLPCIVKPLVSISGSKYDITICHTHKELSEFLSYLTKSGGNKVLIQDLINLNENEEICITGVSVPRKDIIIKGYIKKYRSVGNGSTSFGKYHVSISPEIEQKVKCFINKTNFTGIFDMECFISNHQELTFIECNFRNGAYGYATSRAGFNLPYIYYTLMSGSKLPIIKKMRDVVFMEERLDILNVKEKKISIIHWFKDLLQTDVFLYANRNDIGPMLRIPYSLKKVFSQICGK